MVYCNNICNVPDVYTLLQKEPHVTPSSEVVYPDLEEGSFLNWISSIGEYLKIPAFIIALSATTILLRHYAKKMPKIKFALIIALPLVLNLSTALDVLNIYDTDTDQGLFYYYILTSFNSSAGAVLFGVAFWYTGKLLPKDNPIRAYIIMTACGIVLTYMSTESYLSVASYPPFGLFGVSLQIISPYLLFIGLYSCAVSLSQDLQLRQSVRNMVAKDANLLSQDWYGSNGSTSTKSCGRHERCYPKRGNCDGGKNWN